MQTIFGIDQSFGRAGIARIDNNKGQLLVRCRSLPKMTCATAPYMKRHVDIRSQAQSINSSVSDGAALVVIEGPAFSARGQALWQLAALLDQVYRMIDARGIPIAVCSPGTRAKWATGKGNADKDAVGIHVDRMYPDVGKNNDERDALVFATIGAQWLGWPVPERAHHRACLNSVEWPNKESLRSPETQDLLAAGVLTLGS